MSFYLEIMEQLGKPVAEIDKLHKKYWKHSEVRKLKVKKLLSEENYLQAIDILMESLEMDQEVPRLIRGHRLLLKEIYKRLGQQENYLSQLWQQLLHDDRGSLQIFIELKAAYPANEWPDICEKILAKLADFSQVDQLYLEEERYDLLLEFVMKSHSLNKAQRYLKQLKDLYPKELLAKFEAEIRSMTATVPKRKVYRDIAYSLQKMATIPGGTLRMQLLIEELKQAYPRRSTMIDELDNVLNGK